MNEAGVQHQSVRPIRWLARQRVGRVHMIAAVAGLLSNLAYAPFHVFPMLAIGLVTLVWLIDAAKAQPRPLRAIFARAWTFAFFYFLGGLYWIWSAFTMVDGAMIFMPLAVAALPAGLALFWAVALTLAARLWAPGPRRVIVFTLALMAAEILRGHLFGGLPWNLPGYVWPAGGAVSQAASVVGAYGLSAITVLAFAAPATLGDAGSFGPRVAPTIVAALCLGMMWGAGVQRLQQGLPPTTGPIVRVADAGFTQREKWRPGNEYGVFRRYLDLINNPPNQADVVIWPESAIPLLLLEQPDLLEEIGAALGDRVLITGAIRSEPRPDGRVYFNSAVVLDGVAGSLRIGQIYNKNRLVPFGEFIPFWNEIAGLADGLKLKALQQIGSGFEVGDPPSRVIVPDAGSAVILICYESIFPGLTPRGAERPDWIINVTNDAWFGAQTGPWQHFNQARYRAIEEGLPLARAASGGVSAIVDPYGRTIARTGLEGGTVDAILPAPLAPTIFARLGTVPVVIVFLIIGALGIGLRPRRGETTP